ncbi:TIGR00725 family protein [Planctomycetota bacterium]|nr:TIGR00725 family protein [Planctomycetota bacterium]
MKTRFKISVIGDGDVEQDTSQYILAYELGKKLVDHGYYVVSGGRGGVMEAVSKGAHNSEQYECGCVIGYLMGHDASEANEWVDVGVPTGLGHMRNAIVAQSDAVIAVGGSAGTLSEICFAWIFGRLVIAIEGEGWAGRLAGQCLDERVRYRDIPDDCIYRAKNAEEVIQLLNEHLETYVKQYSK